MKRVLLLTVALCLTVASSFAQKKSVSSAQSMANGETPNFAEARTLIKGALENPETKDDAKTWYVAGLVEMQQFKNEQAKLFLGQAANEPVMYEALGSVLPYYLKAAELDQLPNVKGKIKPKFTKDIKTDLSTNHIWYINAGSHFFEAKNFQKAYDLFDQYVKIGDLDMFKGEPTAAQDSNYQLAKYYRGVFATQLEDHENAIRFFEDLKQYDYRPNEVYQYLCIEYQTVKDTVNFMKNLQEGVQKFPGDEYFLLNLINQYVYSNKTDEAVKYLNTAIELSPSNVQLYTVLGTMHEKKEDFVSAEKSFKKALELDPNYTEALGNLGRLFYNAGVNKLGEANLINDSKLYQEEKAKASALFEKALPYYQQAFKAKPESKEYMIALSSIYYQLDMGEELKAIDELMKKTEE